MLTPRNQFKRATIISTRCRIVFCCQRAWLLEADAWEVRVAPRADRRRGQRQAMRGSHLLPPQNAKGGPPRSARPHHQPLTGDTYALLRKANMSPPPLLVLDAPLAEARASCAGGWSWASPRPVRLPGCRRWPLPGSLARRTRQKGRTMARAPHSVSVRWRGRPTPDGRASCGTTG